MRQIFYLSCVLFLLAACEELFEYHPNQIRLEGHEQNLTAHYLRKINSQKPQDTLRILVMGDTQRFYDDTQDFVRKANSLPDVDFVIHLGDITDFGMSKEFRWVHDIMRDLRWPYLTVIGNHDMLGNAQKMYRQMYGEQNYSFVYGSTKFVFLDTNGREYGFKGKVPDLDWLSKELKARDGEEWTQAIVVSHVPPFDNDFDPQLELPFHKALTGSKVVSLSLHGHKHGWTTETAYDDDVLYHVTTTVKKRGFTLLKVWKTGYAIEQVAF